MADGMDGGKVDHIKAHGGNGRKAAGGIPKGSVKPGNRSGASGKEFVPGPPKGPLPLDMNPKGPGKGHEEWIGKSPGLISPLLVQGQRHPLVEISLLLPSGEPLGQVSNLPPLAGPGHVATDDLGPFQKPDPVILPLTGPDLFLQTFLPMRHLVDPGPDPKQNHSLPAHDPGGRPEIVALGDHGLAFPGFLSGITDLEDDPKGFVAVGNHVGLDVEGLSGYSLGGVPAFVHRRSHTLDPDPVATVGQELFGRGHYNRGMICVFQ